MPSMCGHYHGCCDCDDGAPARKKDVGDERVGRLGRLNIDYSFLFVDGQCTNLAVGSSRARNGRRWAGVVTLCSQAELDHEHDNYQAVAHPPTLHIPIDECNGGASVHFPMILAFIRHYQAERDQVLIHCSAGRVRAPAVAMLVLMALHGLSEDRAYEEVQRVRREARPGRVLIREVRMFLSTGPSKAELQCESGTEG